MVPDLALIEIFDFYMAEGVNNAASQCCREAWIILAHVCRKWRDIVFGSPSRLNVQLLFKAQRSVKAMLDTWPPLPIGIWGSDLRVRDVDNIIAALEHTDRIYKIELCDPSLFRLEQAFAAMQKPFPSLKELAVIYVDEWERLAVPDSFLSGSAPLLRSLWLRSIQIPLALLRNLLLSATDLVELHILKIPNSGLISPEAMVACLSGLNRLEKFELGFRSLRNWRSPGLPPSTPCVLPTLTLLRFDGSCEYLEDLIAPIDSPLLDNLDVTVFRQPGSATPQLAQFVDRTPKLKALHEARIVFGDSAFVSFSRTRPRGLDFSITCLPSDQLSVMTQLCTLSFLRTLIPMIKHLYILDSGTQNLFRIAGSRWKDLLCPFTTVEDLYLSRKFSPHIVPALQGIIEEGAMEVLPSLLNLFLQRGLLPHLGFGSAGEAVIRFVAAVHLSSRPIVVSHWDT